MYYYSLMYTSPEDSSELLFTCDTVLSKEEFDSIAEDAYVNAAKRYIEEDTNSLHESFARLFGEPAYLIAAMRARGFEHVAPIQRHYVSGWAGMMYPGDWSEKGESTYTLQERIKAALVQRFGDHLKCAICGKVFTEPYGEQSVCDKCGRSVCCYEYTEDGESICATCAG